LFALLFLAAFLAASLNGFGRNCHILLIRFVLLFSFISSISMGCNLNVSATQAWPRPVSLHGEDRNSHDEGNGISEAADW
jgi:hypothetical protein